MGVETWVAVASAAVALLSALLTLWVRWRDRAQADWVAGAQATTTSSGVRWSFFTLRNCGDGTAYRLVLIGEHCTAGLVDHRLDEACERIPVPYAVAPQVPPGEEVSVAASMVLGDAQHLGTQAGIVTIEWLRTPTRHHRTQSVRVDIAAVEAGVRVGDGSLLILHEPWWWRLRSSRARATRRAARWLPAERTQLPPLR